MMPLAEQSHLKQSKRRRTEAGSSRSQAVLYAAQTSNPDFSTKISQVDGAGDDEDDEDDKAGIKDELFDDDDDENAINSDLDDPDDALPEEEQEEGRPSQIMLCTYDKVARVKNKWKCTLKDGVLTTGGKEYVTDALSSVELSYLLKADTSSIEPRANLNGRDIGVLAMDAFLFKESSVLSIVVRPGYLLYLLMQQLILRMMLTSAWYGFYEAKFYFRNGLKRPK